MDNHILAILNKAAAGERISFAEGVLLLKEADLLALGQVASMTARRLHPEGMVTFVIDRNVNYTNICTMGCKFCAFHKAPGHPEGYVLPWETIAEKIRELVEAGGTQLLMQGGLNPDLGLDYYLDLIARIKANFPVHIHSLSPPEIWHIADQSGLSIGEVLAKLKEAGLDSLPGGGAEILDNRVREIISPKKISWEKWMAVMETAHGLGLKTTATMMFGSVDTPEDQVMHLQRVRDLQDRTGGFTAFIPWSFQPTHTQLAPYTEGREATGVEYLKILAVSRIFLDNVPNIQASWVTQGAKLAQVALSFGANDFGGTMLEENVVRAAGVANRVPLEEILNCIRDAGYRPAQRNTLYQILREF